jgi:hypothetical protein
MAYPAYIDAATGELTDPEAWVALQSQPVGNVSSVTFTSTNNGQIGDWSHYLDLFFLYYVRTDRISTSDVVKATVNQDTSSSNYSMQRLYGYAGGVATNYSASAGYGFCELECSGASSPTGNFAAGYIHCFDVNSGKFKSNYLTCAVDGWVSGSATSSGWMHIQANIWRSQDAITEIKFEPAFGSNIVSGSRIDLFGILPRMAF